MAPLAHCTSTVAATLSALTLSLLLAACGGGKSNDVTPAVAAAAPCVSNTCSGTGVTTQRNDAAQLCPSALDYGTTFTGGSGSGEYIKLKFDTATKQYQLTFVESEVPTSAGEVNETRAGLTIIGSYENANRYSITDAHGHASTPLALPSAEQNRCAFVVKSGATADGRYSVTVNPEDPPMFFVGNGIVGGGIPGAAIEFGGIQVVRGFNIGKVPRKTFDYYPFVAFSNTVTDFAKVAGDYNELGIHLTPEGGNFQTTADNPAGVALGWQPDGVQAAETFHADGSCVADDASDAAACSTTGTHWTLRTNADGSPDNVFTSGKVAGVPPSGPIYPAVGNGTLQEALAPNFAHGIMIVGNLDGQPVPVIIRVGYAHAGTDLASSALDDQIGISLLAPASRVQPSAFSGAFIGANSASVCGIVSAFAPTAPGVYEGACLDDTATANVGVNYTSTIFQSPSAAFFNPFSSTAATNFTFDYTQTQPGLVRLTAENDFVAGHAAVFKRGDTGSLIKVGPVFALLMNGTGLPNPFFTIGAFVQ
jgi:hypothetical protein